MNNESSQTSQEEQELYRFGYKLLLLQAINIAVVIAIGLLCSCLKEMVFFLMGYIPLRSYAGGYHAGGPVRCGILSAAMELAVAVVLRIPVPGLAAEGMLATAVVCEVIIYVTAPVAACNKPLTDSQVLTFRRNARIILGVEAIIMIALYAFWHHRLWMTIAMGHVFVAGLLIAGKFVKSE